MNWLISDPIQDYLSCWVQSILRDSCWDVIHVNGMELKLTDKLPFICWQVYNARIEVAGGPWEIWGISRSGSSSGIRSDPGESKPLKYRNLLNVPVDPSVFVFLTHVLHPLFYLTIWHPPLKWIGCQVKLQKKACQQKRLSGVVAQAAHPRANRYKNWQRRNIFH